MGQQAVKPVMTLLSYRAVSLVTAGVRYCHRGTRRAGRLVMAAGLLLLASAWIVAEPAFGIDLRDWGRNMRRHKDWTSVEFRHPFTGMFIASRAGTEDLARYATLTLTASPLENCTANTVVVIKRRTPNPVDVERISRVGIDIDGLNFAETDARIVMPKGDQFEFIEILGPFATARLNEGRTMTISLGQGQIARFSLKGFTSAWTEARRTCRKFVRH